MENYQAEELIKYINKFRAKRIMVLGDLIADKFIIADPERLSLEAPVLILKHQGLQASKECRCTMSRGIG
jgi:bifunctional ADP-heptose synthase (sugar kinase/adenylyltransferase)